MTLQTLSPLSEPSTAAWFIRERRPEIDESRERTKRKSPTKKRRKGFGIMTIKRVLYNFMECSSLNALPFIINAENGFIKFFWIFTFLAGTAAMLFHLSYVVHTYLLYATTTGITFENSQLTFPDVLICNKNTVRRSMINNLTNNKFKKFLRLFQDANISDSKRPIQKVVNIKNPLGKQTTSWRQNIRSQMKLYYGSENRQVRENVGHQIDDMLLNCEFDGESCSAQDFRLVNTMDYGNCFFFNSSDRKMTTPGSEHGLHVEFFLQGDEFIPYLSQFGLQTLISAPDTIQFPNDLGIYASANFETRISLRQNHIERLGGSYGTCNKSSTKLGRKNKVYTFYACYILCGIRYAEKVCGCVNLEDRDFANFLKMEKDLTFCNISQSLCVEEAKESTRNGSVSECSKLCYNPCNETTYSLTISTQIWPDIYEVESLVNDICMNNMSGCAYLRKLDYLQKRDNFAALTIFYEQMQYTFYNEGESYGTVSFASDFGGTMGLWIGISVITIIEIIYFLFRLGTTLIQIFCNKSISKTTDIEMH